MKLKDICEINPRTLNIGDDTEVSFIPMPSVSEDGKIDTSDIRTYADVKRGYTTFKENDVLFAKITPCMENGKGAVACGLKNGYGCGSSEFHVLRATELVIPEWLYYLTVRESFRKEAEKHMTGSAGQRRVPRQYLENYTVNIPPLSQQEQQVQILSRLKLTIDHRKEQLKAFDDLIKARFVELFGDPVINSENLATMPMTDVCEIIDGDRGKNYPTADEFSDEGYCLFLNAKNVTASGFNFDNCMFVSKEKDEALRKGKLSRGDVVLTTRGTLGNLAFYTDEIPFENVRINSGMVILRMKQDVIDEVYFIEQFKMQLDDIKEKIASGSAQPQLPISTMNKIQVLIPDIERQKEFSEFIKQVDKSKVV